MTEKRKIDKVYFITHPAFDFLHEEFDIKKFITDTIHRVIKRAQADPNSIVGLLKTPLLELPNQHELDPEIMRQVHEIESKLEEFVVRLMKNRGFVIKKTHLIRVSSVELEKLASSRNMDISKTAHVEGYGAWRTLCAKVFPEDFRTYMKIRGKFVVPESGTIKKPRKYYRK